MARSAPGTAAASTGAAGPACTAAGSGDLGWSLHVLSRAYADRATRAVADVPDGLRGYLLLTRVANENASSQLALASLLGLDRTVMTYLLDDLQAAGLIERRPDPNDRRARQVFITPAGAAALRRAQDRLAEAEVDTLAGLDPAERETLCDLVHRVAATLTADRDCAPRGADDCGAPAGC